LSAVDLFHRIVNALSKVSRTGLQEPKSSGISFMGGASAARMEKFRVEARGLRLDAMRALRQVLASLNASIVVQMSVKERQLALVAAEAAAAATSTESSGNISIDEAGSTDSANVSIDNGTHNLVEMYGSKKKRRAEESEAILRFNQKPSAGIVYAGKCGHVDVADPVDVARYLLKNKDTFEKTQIGEYLGREAEYQNGFCLKVLHEYVRLLDFEGLMFDDAIRFFLSGFRLPGEAQKVCLMNFLTWDIDVQSISMAHRISPHFVCRLIESWKSLPSASQSKTRRCSRRQTLRSSWRFRLLCSIQISITQRSKRTVE
jgi:brefeldin A-inhibited guanine nucleotide-exchange protein